MAWSDLTITESDLRGEQYPSLFDTTSFVVAAGALVQAAGVATLTQAEHGLNVGDTFAVSGANETEYNGNHSVATVPDADTFTFSVDSGAGTPATGTIEVLARIIRAGLLTSETIGKARDLAADLLVIRSVEYVKAFGGETAYLDAVQAAAELAVRLSRLHLRCFLHLLFHGSFGFVGNTDHVRADKFYSDAYEMARTVSGLQVQFIAPPVTPKKRRRAQSMSVSVPGTYDLG